MREPGLTMVVVGALLVAGLVADWAERHLPLPRVSVLILLGVFVGPAGLDLLPPDREQWFPVVSAVALVMVGFLIGGEFTREQLGALGRRAGVVAVGQGAGAGAAVGAGLLAVGVDPRLALPLAGIAAATAPAAIAGVVADHARNSPFSRLLLAAAALADAFSLLLFSLLVVVAGVLYGTGQVDAAVRMAAWDLGGAVALGLALGVPGALLSGRLDPGRPILEEALGLVLLCAGAALWLDVSFVLASLVMGAVVANLATHHERPFRQIEGIEWPFLVVFFVLAGASLELGALRGAGVAAVAYVALRAAGKLIGGRFGARVAGMDRVSGRWIGPALLPQAGVALGLALLAEEQLPEVGADVLAIVVVSTVAFELTGPILTRMAVQRGARQDSASPRRGSH